MLLGAVLAVNVVAAAPNQQNVLPPTVPDEIVWNEVDRPGKLDVLTMLANQTKGNYEKIRTWEGLYKVHLAQYLSETFVAEAFGNHLQEGQAESLMQEFDYTMKFAIDMSSGAIYRSKDTSMMRFISEESGEKVVIPRTKPADVDSIVTNEHFVYFSPKGGKSTLAVVQDFPDAQNKRVAHRASVEQSAHQHRGDLMDPRMFFGFGGEERFWETLSLYVREMKGDAGAEQQRKTESGVVVEQGNRSDGAWFRLRFALNGPTGSQESMTTVWSAVAGFNPVSYVYSRAGEPQPITITEWHWKSVDDVMVPVVLTHINYRGPSQVAYQREVELQSCDLNHKLPEDQFTYSGLGLKNGDLIDDKLERVVLLIKNGEPELLANFGDRYVPPRESNSTGGQWLLVGGNIVVVVVLLLVLLRRRLVLVRAK